MAVPLETPLPYSVKISKRYQALMLLRQPMGASNVGTTSYDCESLRPVVQLQHLVDSPSAAP